MKYSGIRIVIVEDNPNDVELMRRVLRERHLAEEIVVLKDGAEATEFLLGEGQLTDPRSSDIPKVILLDLKLPKVDGLEVLRRIKADRRTKHIPVVVLTSSSERPDLVAAYDLGANSYVSKPIKFEEFSQVLGAVAAYWVTLNKSTGLR